MQFLTIAWRILVNLFTGGVILAMFHVANSRFESLVVSASVLIYVTVIGSYMSLGYILSRKWNVDLARYISLAKAIGLSTEIEEGAQRENREEDRKGQVLFWIATGFNMLYGLIAIGNLLYIIAL